MKNSLVGVAILAATVVAAPALAEPAEVEYPQGSLGYSALLDSDYARAEAQLRSDNGVSSSDPARLINLGQVLARTGRTGEAARLFKQVRSSDNVEVVLADGRTMGSQEAANRALRALRTRFASR